MDHRWKRIIAGFVIFLTGVKSYPALISSCTTSVISWIHFTIIYWIKENIEVAYNPVTFSLSQSCHNPGIFFQETSSAGLCRISGLFCLYLIEDF